MTSNTKCTGGQSLTAISGNENTFVQWNVNVASAGTYLISLRYAHDTSPRPLSVSIMECSDDVYSPFVALTSNHLLGLREHARD